MEKEVLQTQETVGVGGCPGERGSFPFLPLLRISRKQAVAHLSLYYLLDTVISVFTWGQQILKQALAFK